MQQQRPRSRCRCGAAGWRSDFCPPLGGRAGGRPICGGLGRPVPAACLRARERLVAARRLARRHRTLLIHGPGRPSARLVDVLRLGAGPSQCGLGPLRGRPVFTKRGSGRRPQKARLLPAAPRGPGRGRRPARPLRPRGPGARAEETVALRAARRRAAQRLAARPVLAAAAAFGAEPPALPTRPPGALGSECSARGRELAGGAIDQVRGRGAADAPCCGAAARHAHRGRRVRWARADGRLHARRGRGRGRRRRRG
mmetsp:Transcript_29134/g.83630  ORF Transcript_29134/g.83630 Transcript_29134/m.83630 type:complete len:255 (-) Transcript_29134:380-1144(-)